MQSVFIFLSVLWWAVGNQSSKHIRSNLIWKAQSVSKHKGFTLCISILSTLYSRNWFSLLQMCPFKKAFDPNHWKHWLLIVKTHWFLQAKFQWVFFKADSRFSIRIFMPDTFTWLYLRNYYHAVTLENPANFTSFWNMTVLYNLFWLVHLASHSFNLRNILYKINVSKMSPVSRTLVGVIIWKFPIMNSCESNVMWSHPDRGSVLAVPVTGCDLGERLQLSRSQCPHYYIIVRTHSGNKWQSSQIKLGTE